MTRSAITPAQSPKTGVTRSFATFRTLLALILREMGTRYGRSPGGYIWAVLEPLGAIAILGLAFSLIVRAPSLGNSFVLFYATGYLPFSLYTEISSTVARSLKFSKALLFYPSVTWIDAVLARFILNSLTGLMVTYILLAGILLLNDTRVVLDLVSIFQALSLAIFLGLGIGVLNCLLMGLFPIWERIWSIVTRPLFLASGVFFVLEDLPAVAQDILWYNPLIHITGLMRMGFYPMYSPGYISIVYVITCTLVTLAMGLLLLQRHHKKILND